MFNNKFFKLIKFEKSIVTRNVDQIFTGNLFTQFFTCNLDNISVFQAVKSGYTKFHQSKKSLKVVNNASVIRF